MRHNLAAAAKVDSQYVDQGSGGSSRVGVLEAVHGGGVEGQELEGNSGLVPQQGWEIA